MNEEDLKALAKKIKDGEASDEEKKQFFDEFSALNKSANEDLDEIISDKDNEN